MVFESFEWNIKKIFLALVSNKIENNTDFFFILGFPVTSQALFKSVSAMLVSLGCQIYANNSPFLQ